jgi:serine/threonine protein kinase
MYEEPASSNVPPRTTSGGGRRWEPPSPEELQRMLPQFEVECLIGRGGMGAVYRGIQSSLERTVAIKLLPPAIEEQDGAFAERFKNEARLMGRMNHPAIVSVYDFGRTTEGQLYFVMEYVDGTDVQRMIAREGRLPSEHALAVTAHLCDALGYAHKQGIVHRDIKPSNVLIDREGRVKVADFGLAKLTTNTQNSGLTQTGMAMGTPDYVAPETLMFGSDVDGRADLYAVGVMLYQMLTGDIPRGMFKMPSQKFQSIDPRFDDIVRRALEHDRDERYQSSLELRRDLDVILSTPFAVAGKESSAVLPKQAATPPGRTVVPSSRNPASTPQRRQQPVFESHVPPPAPPQTSTLPYVIAALVMLSFGGWFVMQNTQPTAAPETTDTSESPFSPSLTSATTTTAPAPTFPPPTVTPERTPPPAMTTPPSTTATTTRPTSSVPPPSTSVPPAKTIPPTLVPPTTGTSGSITDRLITLESQFQIAFERDVNASYADQIATLGTGYVAALDRAINEAARNGRVSETIALRDEKTRFTTHKFMPSIDPSGLHSSIVQLRNTYRSTEKAYSKDKDAKSLPLYDRYIQVLDALEKEVLAQGRTADATRVRVKRDDVTARRKQRAAKVSSSTVPSAQSMPALISLFDGQSLNGWRVVGDADSFTVSHGEIRSTGRRGNLIYVGASGVAPVWKDFNLDIKIKCPDAANSGIWLHIPDPTTILNRKVSAFEVNIDERGKGTTGDILAAVEINTGAPMNSQLEKRRPYLSSIKNPPSGGRFDQWQALRVMARSGVFTVWIDGRQVNQWSFPAGWTPPPDKDYVQTFAGTIGLQSGAGVAFKDITVQML